MKKNRGNYDGIVMLRLCGKEFFDFFEDEKWGDGEWHRLRKGVLSIRAEHFDDFAVFARKYKRDGSDLDEEFDKIVDFMFYEALEDGMKLYPDYYCDIIGYDYLYFLENQTDGIPYMTSGSATYIEDRRNGRLKKDAGTVGVQRQTESAVNDTLTAAIYSCSLDFLPDKDWPGDEWFVVKKDGTILIDIDHFSEIKKISQKLHKEGNEINRTELSKRLDAVLKKALKNIQLCHPQMFQSIKTYESFYTLPDDGENPWEIWIIEESITELDKEATPRKPYRTKSKISYSSDAVIVNPPQNIAVITQKDYRYAISLHKECNAYISRISGDGLTITKDGKLMINGFAATKTDIMKLQDNEFIRVDSVDVSFLRPFYSVLLKSYKNDRDNGRNPNTTIKLYIPEMFKMLGKSSHPDRERVLAEIKHIMSYHNILGYINGDLLPLLLYQGESTKENTICFSSPYMFRVIDTIYKEEEEAAKKRKNPASYSKPTHSWLIKGSITKERNKRAIEIVVIVITLIEQAGSLKGRPPHISAKTIVERIPILYYDIYESDKSTGDKNKILKSSFSKAWELLRTQTELQTAYKDIKLPDPKSMDNIPSMSTIEDMSFSFPHAGKKKDRAVQSMEASNPADSGDCI